MWGSSTEGKMVWSGALGMGYQTEDGVSDMDGVPVRGGAPDKGWNSNWGRVPVMVWDTRQGMESRQVMIGTR